MLHTEVLLVLVGLLPGLLVGGYAGVQLRRRRAPAPPAPPTSVRAIALEELREMYLTARQIRAAAQKHAESGFHYTVGELLKSAAAVEARAEALRQRLATITDEDASVLEELRAVRS